MDILNKYTPKSFNEFKSNYIQIENIKKYINNDLKGFNLIIGTISSGKTTLLEIINKLPNVECLFIDSNNIGLNDNIKDLLYNFSLNKTISSFFIKKKKIIVIDDIVLLQSIDKKLYSYIGDIKHQLLILATVQTKDSSKTLELKKQISFEYPITLNKITFQDCFIFINDIIDKEDLEDNINHENIISLIKFHNNDLRKIFNDESFFKTNIDSNDNKQHDNDNYYIDQTVYDLTHKIFYNELDCDKDKSYFDNDISMVLNIVHENYPKRCFTSKKITKENLLCLMDISYIFTISDIYDNQIYTNHNWYLLAHKHRHIYPIINKLLVSNINDRFKKDTSYPFTSIFTTLSAKSILHKNIQQLQLPFNNSHVLKIIFNMVIAKEDLKLDNKDINSILGKIKKDFTILKKQ